METQEEESQADLDDAVVRPIQETDQDTPETVGNLGTVHTGSRIEETIGPEVNTVNVPGTEELSLEVSDQSTRWGDQQNLRRGNDSRRATRTHTSPQLVIHLPKTTKFPVKFL